ncbi:hypothetical protein COO60DRAFT_328391 [Scenedesmus sp. NREL 46B-D3]|nr:hypothetical protein COO60DRAFT_328391 [Scenedesmus sp. NREL 46B-D3]
MLRQQSYIDGVCCGSGITEAHDLLLLLLLLLLHAYGSAAATCNRVSAAANVLGACVAGAETGCLHRSDLHAPGTMCTSCVGDLLATSYYDRSPGCIYYLALVAVTQLFPQQAFDHSNRYTELCHLKLS